MIAVLVALTSSATTLLLTNRPHDEKSATPIMFSEEPGLGKPDLRACDYDEHTRGYLSSVQFGKLQALYRNQPHQAPFDGLSPSQEAITAAALTLGPSRAAYSDRLLRSFEMVRELDLQKDCMIGSACSVTADPEDVILADNLKTGAPDDPNKSIAWIDLGAQWRMYVKQDIDAARVCFAY